MPNDRLKRLADQLQQQEETKRGMRLASTRQRNMMPDDPVIDGYEFFTSYQPVAGVSGDFYDFFTNVNGNLGIVIGDVSGHGFEAGIIMGMAKAYISVYGRRHDSPREVLAMANRDLHKVMDGKTFVSVCYGVLDTASRIIRFARAGQNPPVIFNPRWETGELVKVASVGLALGVDKGNRFEKVLQEVQVQLQPGDHCLQFTDGVVEATNLQKEQYDDHRVEKLVKDYGRGGAREMTEIIQEDLKDFTRGAELEDDITFVSFKVLR
jgi:sigma-B regulation protein RsbU (phosphoserine phosphatase)